MSPRISYPKKLATQTTNIEKHNSSPFYGVVLTVPFGALSFFYTLSPYAIRARRHAADGEDPGQGQNAAAHGGGAEVNHLGVGAGDGVMVKECKRHSGKMWKTMDLNPTIPLTITVCILCV